MSSWPGNVFNSLKNVATKVLNKSTVKAKLRSCFCSHCLLIFLLKFCETKLSFLLWLHLFHLHELQSVNL